MTTDEYVESTFWLAVVGVTVLGLLFVYSVAANRKKLRKLAAVDTYAGVMANIREQQEHNLAIQQGLRELTHENRNLLGVIKNYAALIDVQKDAAGRVAERAVKIADKTVEAADKLVPAADRIEGAVAKVVGNGS